MMVGETKPFRQDEEWGAGCEQRRTGRDEELAHEASLRSAF